ncbi:MAG TPA: hypothetical protein VGL92_15185 [Acidimicrobiia bacterium]|jgi:hypothetical protein
MDREAARQLAASVAWGRIGLGVTAVLTPSVPLRPWVGREIAWRPRAKLLARALGFRDIALGLGVVMALRQDAPVRGWVEGGGLADAGDLVATLLAFGTLPKFGRWVVLASAAGAVAASGLAAPAVDR